MRDKLLSTSGVTKTAVTETQIVAALDAELERLFDARIGAGTSSGAFTITDQEGRRLKVSQGAGDGSMFGTDEANSGGLLARETMRNNLNFAWKVIRWSLLILGVERLLCLVSQLHQIVRYCLML